MSESQSATCPIPAAEDTAWTLAEKVEATLIVAATLGLGVATRGLEWSPQLGAFLAYGAALLLGQGLVRDLVRLIARKGSSEPTEVSLCLCAETTLGVTALGAGIALLGLGVEGQVQLTGTSLTLIAGGILTAGFFVKDYVLSVRKVKDHSSIGIGR